MMSSNCLWAFQKELLDESENIRFGKTVWEDHKSCSSIFFMIEFTQLLFHLGTFQISDLTYNTLGGAAGGIIYYLGHCRKGREKINKKQRTAIGALVRSKESSVLGVN